jgi:magnesium chelatase family protein
LADRIDITRHVAPVQPHRGTDPFDPPEPSAAIRGRVELARMRQEQRYAGCDWRLNSHAPGPALTAQWPLTAAGQLVLDNALYSGRLSRRGATRVHRLAWTVADLAGADRPDAPEVDTALRLRAAQPLMLEILHRRAAG